MAKVQKAYFCQNCGAQASKWIGKCPACGEWNTYVEEVLKKEKSGRESFTDSKRTNHPQPLIDITPKADSRTITTDGELNRVLGGGIVDGSLVLIGGEPGIGKSTLMLQMALNTNQRVLYISGEESENQIKMRADRIGISNQNCYVLTETNLQGIFAEAKIIQPEIIIIDSIQTLHSDVIEATPGSISQIRECAGEFLRYSKQTNIPVFLIGHITKDGNIAGPKILEHMVDTVLQFEGDRHHTYRILRTIKNRFGSTSELGIYEMQGSGLREVSNPSEVLLSQREDALSGIAIGCAIEGLRPILIEAQALVGNAVYAAPQRTATGYDLRRLSMLLAVLEKRCGFRLGTQDVFINIAGGIRIDDPAIDLSIIAAILSSYEDIAIDQNIAFAGEVGLSGEIRAVNKIEQRIAEAEKLGFKEIFISKYNKKGIDINKLNIKVNFAGKVEEVFEYLFG